MEHAYLTILIYRISLCVPPDFRIGSAYLITVFCLRHWMRNLILSEFVLKPQSKYSLTITKYHLNAKTSFRLKEHDYDF